MNKIFALSENAKLEYSATICRVGEVKPIEGSDFLGKTVINGFDIVVRKDNVFEGDLIIYCPIETVLNSKFLSTNNLYEMGERERNVNYAEVECLREEDKIEEAKSKVGFFNKYGRIKILTLRNVPSMGFIINPKELLNWKPNLDLSNIESYENMTFDTIDNALFIKVYIPFVAEPKQKSGIKTKKNNKIKRFDRLIDGEFSFHYDTNQLNSNMWRFQPDTMVTISLKEHGTSSCNANILVNTPIRLSPVQRMLKKHIDREIFNTHSQLNRSKYKGTSNARWNKLEILKKHKIATSYQKYGSVYSSRGVIKNKYINQNVTGGFYNTDIWGEYNDILFPHIDKGMEVFSEIVGYLTGSQKMIQKGYDYGCEPGKNYLMPYRITTKETGKPKKEWDVIEVEKWTKNLIKNNPNLKERIHPIKILYHGTLGKLYPEISIADHWNENVLEALKNDKIHFGMEENEPLCKNKVPREGLVFRIDGDDKTAAMKLKCLKFYERERKAIDKGEVDTEMEEGYTLSE